MVETDEFVSGNSEGLLMDPITISTAYLKMKQLCKNVGDEIQADIKIHNQHILPRYITVHAREVKKIMKLIRFYKVGTKLAYYYNMLCLQYALTYFTILSQFD